MSDPPMTLRKVLDTLDGVWDPCSVAMGRPLSLVEMDVIRTLSVADNHILVGVCLTEPSCIHAFSIAEAIQGSMRAAFGEEPEVSVEFLTDATPWTEARIDIRARQRLATARAQEAPSAARIGSR